MTSLFNECCPWRTVLNGWCHRGHYSPNDDLEEYNSTSGVLGEQYQMVGFLGGYFSTSGVLGGQHSMPGVQGRHYSTCGIYYSMIGVLGDSTEWLVS